MIQRTSQQRKFACSNSSVEGNNNNQSTTASIERKSNGGGLQETYEVAAVAGEGEEVDLAAVADAAVLPQVGELRRAHAGRNRARTSPREKGPGNRRRRKRYAAGTAALAGKGGGKGGRLGRQAEGARDRINCQTGNVFDEGFAARPSDLSELRFKVLEY